MKDAHNGKQHKTYPILDSIIGNFFQSSVDIAGIINCFHQVVRVHNCTQLQLQLQCGVGAEFRIHLSSLTTSASKIINSAVCTVGILLRLERDPS